MEGRSFGLDVLRSVSIWMVMIAHIAYWFDPASEGMYAKLIKPLLLGVEPFFVLGGFLAAQSFIQLSKRSNGGIINAHDGIAYLMRRWRRTLPNYFLFLFLYALAFSIAKPDFTFDLRYLVFAQNLFWLTPSFFSVSWSLATQEWFYILLPVLIVLASQGANRFWRKYALLIAAIVLIAFSLFARLVYLSDRPADSLEGDLRRIAAYRLDSVAIGVVAGYIYFSAHHWANRNRVLLITFGVVGAFLLSYLRRQPWFYENYFVQLTYYPCFSLMLSFCLPFLHSLPKSSKAWVVATFESTSTWSYSIYLSHVFFKDAMFLAAKAYGLQFGVNSQVMILVIAWFFITYVSSALLYKKFELRWLPARDGKVARGLNKHA